jgi:hypothetical protein
MRQRLANGAGPVEFARLASLETDECVIWPYTKASQRGYGQMYAPGNQKVYVHRQALIHRGIMPKPGEVARHGPCNTPACMNYRHLRWGSHTDNMQDMFRDGTVLVGERNPMATLTAAFVLRMRLEREQSGDSYKAIAERWGVSTMTAFRAITGQSWSAQ